jgi:hypothetical protein
MHVVCVNVPLSFRFIIQPLVAALAIRAGMEDARKGAHF